jgi:succinyl-CoA synthetase beta subunit
MNIHEYQGKEILASYGVRIQRGIVANNAVEAAAAKQLTTETGTSWFVIKAQVHAGGWKRWRSKLAKNLQQVEEVAGQIIECNYYTSNFCRRKKVHKVF